MGGSVIQATAMVQFNDGLGDWESAKGSKWSAEGLQYTGLYQRQSSHIDFHGGKLISNLLRLVWLPGVEQDAWFDS